MKTLEEIADLHHQIARIAPHPDALIQSVTTLQGTARNQERTSLNFTSRIAKENIARDDPRWSGFCQGFHCVEVNLRAIWGGHHHDGTVRTETEIRVHVLDRLDGGMATRTWETRGSWLSEVLADDDVLPLLRRLLGVPEPVAPSHS